MLDAEIDQILRLGVELRTDSPSCEQSAWTSCATSSTPCWSPAGRVGRAGRAMGTDGHPTRHRGRPGHLQTDRAGRVRGRQRHPRQGWSSAAWPTARRRPQAIDQFLAGEPITTAGQTVLDSRSGTSAGRRDARVPRRRGARRSRRVPPDGTDYSPDDAGEQAHRCLRCGCRAHGNCRLEHYAHRVRRRPQPVRRRTPARTSHSRPRRSVLFEPGKCIKCELCVQIAAAGGEPLGLTFVGRGFDVRLGVPFDRSLDDALTKVAAECVAACPTAALWLDQQDVHRSNPQPQEHVGEDGRIESVVGCASTGSELQPSCPTHTHDITLTHASSPSGGPPLRLRGEGSDCGVTETPGMHEATTWEACHAKRYKIARACIGPSGMR